MGRRGLFLLLVLAAACQRRALQTAPVRIVLNAGLTRSADPPVGRMEDVNLLLFGEEGLLEEQRYFRAGDFSGGDGRAELSLTLPLTLRSRLFAAVNFGFPMERIPSWEALQAYRFQLSYPDEYSHGMPLCGALEDVRPGSRGQVTVPVSPLMARVSLRIDRSRLDGDVSFVVHSVEVGHCPRSAAVLGPSRVRGEDDLFARGFIKSYAQADALNREEAPGLSGSVDVYLLENCQGSLPAASPQEKVLGEDPRKSVSSYIEIKAEYRSPTLVNRTDEYLIYRFYPGASHASLDVERGVHYRYIIAPEGTGLHGTGWQVDQTALTRFGSGKMTLRPADIIQAHVGDTVHVWAELDPPDAPFDIGREELEEDRARGLYDYAIDPDGHGVRLFLRAPGTGIVYFQAGWPVTDADGALVIVE